MEAGRGSLAAQRRLTGMGEAGRPSPLELSDLPGGPVPGSKLCEIDDMEDGGAITIVFGENTSRYEIFLQRKGHQVFAYANVCPHARHPLDWVPGRFLDRSGKYLQCKSHGARFRIEDGYCITGPCKGHYLRPVETRQKDGVIYSTS